MSTVYQKVLQIAERFPQHELLVYPEWLARRWSLERAAWTYADIVRAVQSLALRYRDAGIGNGHRVALLLGNRPEHFIHWLALNAVGASKVPLNPDLGAEETAYILAHSEAQFVVATSAIHQTSLEVVAPDAQTFPAARSPRASGVLSEETECAVLYTSGTTGKPKGCVLSNGYFFGWGEWYEAQGGHIALRPGEERLMQVLPTFHVNAVGNSFMGMVFTGGAQVMLDRFHSSTWWQDAIDTGATCFHYLGVIPAMLMSAPPSDLDRKHRMRFGMGGGVSPAHHAPFEARFGVRLLEGWAMTEVGGAGIMVDHEEPRHVGESCIGKPGRPGPPLEARIEADDELVLRARGANPRRRFFSGYLKDAEATAKAWQGGWFHTGDLMRQDAAGCLFFLDRKKNVIRRSGENIAALEVEACLLTHPAVGQAAVVAVPDELRGEEVLAILAAKSGYIGDQALAEAITEHCLARLAYYKAPGYVAFKAELPTTSTLKIRFDAIRDVLKEAFDLRNRKQATRAKR